MTNQEILAQIPKLLANLPEWVTQEVPLDKLHNPQNWHPCGDPTPVAYLYIVEEVEHSFIECPHYLNKEMQPQDEQYHERTYEFDDGTMDGPSLLVYTTPDDSQIIGWQLDID